MIKFKNASGKVVQFWTEGRELFYSVAGSKKRGPVWLLDNSVPTQISVPALNRAVTMPGDPAEQARITAGVAALAESVGANHNFAGAAASAAALQPLPSAHQAPHGEAGGGTLLRRSVSRSPVPTQRQVSASASPTPHRPDPAAAAAALESIVREPPLPASGVGEEGGRGGGGGRVVRRSVSPQPSLADSPPRYSFAGGGASSVHNSHAPPGSVGRGSRRAAAAAAQRAASLGAASASTFRELLADCPPGSPAAAASAAEPTPPAAAAVVVGTGDVSLLRMPSARSSIRSHSQQQKRRSRSSGGGGGAGRGKAGDDGPLCPGCGCGPGLCEAWCPSQWHPAARPAAAAVSLDDADAPSNDGAPAPPCRKFEFDASSLEVAYVHCAVPRLQQPAPPAAASPSAVQSPPGGSSGPGLVMTPLQTPQRVGISTPASEPAAAAAAEEGLLDRSGLDLSTQQQQQQQQQQALRPTGVAFTQSNTEASVAALDICGGFLEGAADGGGSEAAAHLGAPAAVSSRCLLEEGRLPCYTVYTTDWFTKHNMHGGEACVTFEVLGAAGGGGSGGGGGGSVTGGRGDVSVGLQLRAAGGGGGGGAPEAAAAAAAAPLFLEWRGDGRVLLMGNDVARGGGGGGGCSKAAASAGFSAGDQVSLQVSSACGASGSVVLLRNGEAVLPQVRVSLDGAAEALGCCGGGGGFLAVRPFVRLSGGDVGRRVRLVGSGRVVAAAAASLAGRVRGLEEAVCAGALELDAARAVRAADAAAAEALQARAAAGEEAARVADARRAAAEGALEVVEDERRRLEVEVSECERRELRAIASAQKISAYEAENKVLAADLKREESAAAAAEAAALREALREARASDAACGVELAAMRSAAAQAQAELAARAEEAEAVLEDRERGWAEERAAAAAAAAVVAAPPPPLSPAATPTTPRDDEYREKMRRVADKARELARQRKSSGVQTDAAVSFGAAAAAGGSGDAVCWCLRRHAAQRLLAVYYGRLARRAAVERYRRAVVVGGSLLSSPVAVASAAAPAAASSSSPAGAPRSQAGGPFFFDPTSPSVVAPLRGDTAAASWDAAADVAIERSKAALQRALQEVSRALPAQ